MVHFAGCGYLCRRVCPGRHDQGALLATVLRSYGGKGDAAMIRHALCVKCAIEPYYEDSPGACRGCLVLEADNKEEKIYGHSALLLLIVIFIAAAVGFAVGIIF